MNNLIVYAILLGIMLQAGCSLIQVDHQESTVPFGSATRLAIRQQTLNPEAGGNAPVVGQDGRYAATVAETYYEGPKTEAKDGQSVSELIISGK